MYDPHHDAQNGDTDPPPDESMQVPDDLPPGTPIARGRIQYDKGEALNVPRNVPLKSDPPPPVLFGEVPRDDEDHQYLVNLTELEIRQIAHEIGRCRDCGDNVHPDLDKFGRCDDCRDQIPEPYMGYTPGEDDPPEKGAFPGERYMA